MKRNAFLIVLWSALLLCCQWAVAQEPVSPSGKFATVNGAKIYYEEYGQGEPLILLHGFGGTASAWKDFIPEYAKQYHVIAWDMRGHGRSTNPDTSQVFLHATAARDLLALMDQLKLKKVKIMGHSSGGIVILIAATQQPDRFEAIVPISAQVFYSKETRAFIAENAKDKEAFNQMLGLDKAHGKVKANLIARQFYYFRKLQGDPAVTPDQLATITARTLIIHGDNDFVPVSQAWEMFTNIPHAHLWVSPNASHGPQFGPHQADFIKRTLEFLRGDWEKSDLPK
jgi:pimeloyl-ACP methyl ester carboxylesterase